MAYIGRRTLGPPNSDSLGAALFGPDNGPIPAIEGGGGGVDPEVYDALGEDQESSYMDTAKQYLQQLQQPVTLPQPGPVPHGLAFAMAMNPGSMKDMLALQREPYQTQLEQIQFNEGRQAKAADLATRLAQQEEQRQERVWEKRHVWEQAAANSGNVNYPYQVPGMKDQAQQVDAARRSLIGQRNRSNMGTGVKPKFATKQAHMAWLEGRLSARQRELLQTYQVKASTPGWDKDEAAVNVLGDAEGDYSWLRKQRDAIGKMSDSQWQRFSQLPDQEQQAVIDAMQGNGNEGGGPAVPPPWAGQPAGAGAPLPPPWK